MNFNSLKFLIFFIVVFAIIWAVDKFGDIFRGALRSNLRHIVLLVASYYFYMSWDWRFGGLLFLVTLAAYLTSAMVRRGSHKKLFLAAGVVIPLAALALFKYFDFFTQSFIDLFDIAYSPALRFILPVGISFYTFQALSYVIDVYRGDTEYEQSFIRVALYISFFPQLVAGPIVKAKDFLPQLNQDRRVSAAGIAEGYQMILFGLFKKIVIADRLSVFVDDVYASPDLFNGPTILLAIVSYTLQIYCDFSGYSDIAIGCAKILGYDLKRNFNLIYISQSLDEYWKRNHISLSTWLKEYLYFPLGGNRKGKVRTYINLMLTMVIGGFWHGADWTFVFWGGLHGIGICVQKLYNQIRGKREKTLPKRVACVVMTYIYLCLTLVFFRAASFENAFDVLSRLFVWNTGVSQPYVWSFVAIIVYGIASALAIIRAKKNGETGFINGFYPNLDLRKFSSLVILFFMTGLLLVLAYTGANPFIYFQF